MVFYRVILYDITLFFIIFHFNQQTGNSSLLKSMLTLSHKPQILRLHSLEQRQRQRFTSAFQLTTSELLTELKLFPPPSTSNSLFLKQLPAFLPDLYYTWITMCTCRRRLGEEYTYIAMWNKKHYQQEGVLVNKKVRALMAIAQILGRNVVTPLIKRAFQKEGLVFEDQKSNGKHGSSFSKSVLSKFKLFLGSVIKTAKQYLGSPEQLIANVEWLVLMIYMLDWNKYFTFLQTIFGISYAYTYQNDQIKEVSYTIEGYLLLVTFIVKAIKTVFRAIKNKPKRDPLPKLEAKPEIQKKDKAEEPKEEKSLCRICYDDITDKSSTKCGHVFCWSCIIRSLEISPECPVCRSSCQPREVVQLRNY